MKLGKNKALAIIATVIILLVITIGLYQNRTVETVTKSGFLLDTFVSITLFGQTDETLLQEPFDRIKELNDVLTAFEEGSDCQEIKENAGVAPVVVSDETIAIIKESLQFSLLSDGKFDVTIGPLVDLWGIESPEVKEPPTAEEVEAAKSLVDYQKLFLNETDKTVYLEEAGMAVNFGAIAKGYIADEIMGMLRNEGVQHALIDLGGNILVMGGKTDSQPFGIGVEDPLNPGQGYIGVISISDGSVVTSGNYQRYFTDSSGVRYHHILDPDTGYPADSGVIQVSVIAEKSIDADALSTTLFLLGTKQGLELVEGLDQVEAIFITDDHQIVMSSGAENYFVFDKENYGETYSISE
ncbi:FAD:protein FMN transferase [Eubacteriaceae bacterium ES3]|nr:FAD:protein FMN transferase [Eubacteriaceae bacterium ES3]